MTKLVTIFGGSGFVGRYIAWRMAQQGWRVRVAVRRPEQAGFVRPYGSPGQVEPVLCNIRDDASVAAALEGASAVVNSVGILFETSKNRFDSVQSEGAARVARLSAEAGIETFVQISAIGADAESPSAYSRTKAAGETAVLDAIPGAAILRPSIVFGQEDQFFNRFASMARTSPFIPLFGSRTRFQPVYVDDVAKAAEKVLMGEASGGVYELGGPQIYTFREMIRFMLDTIRRRRVILGLPMWVGRFMAFGFDALEFVSLGLIKNRMVTRDQLKNLAKDNVVSDEAKSFGDLGIVPVPMETVVPEYLIRFRPSGQYDEMKESARGV